MADTTFRKATPADFPAIETLLRAAELPTEGVAAIIGNDDGGFLVAERGGEVVGGGALELAAGDALLRSGFVREDLRSAGIGRFLVQQLLEDARGRGLDGVYLLTTTADNWFPRFGFKVVDRGSVPEPIAATWEFKTGCCETAVAMCRPCRVRSDG